MEKDCVSCGLAIRMEAVEKAIDEAKRERSNSHEKIYSRLGALERGMATVTTQYGQIMSQLTTMQADILSIKDKPARRWEAVVAAIVTGVVGYLVATLIS